MKLITYNDVFQHNMTNLFKLIRNHGESFEDDLRGASDGDDALGAGAVGNINTSPTLKSHREKNIHELWASF